MRPIGERLAGPGLAMGSMCCIQFGAAVSVPVMAAHGSFGITAMRLGCAAFAMLLLARPNFRRFGRRQWGAAIALGVTTALMTLAYFAALTRIPVGAATTIEFLGPLAVAVASLRGWSRLTLPLLAACGVLALALGRGGWMFDPAGMLFALIGGCGWGSYIVLTRHVGQLFVKQEGLALSLIVAAAVALPLIYMVTPAELALAQLPASAVLSLLTPLIPYTLEMMALRRMRMGAFSIMMSLEPALGTIFGFIVLGQRLSLRQVGGVAAVMVASLAAIYLTSLRREATDAAPVETAVLCKP